MSAGAFAILALYGLFLVVVVVVGAPLRGREVECRLFFFGAGASWVVAMAALVVLWRRQRWLAIAMPIAWLR